MLAKYIYLLFLSLACLNFSSSSAQSIIALGEAKELAQTTPGPISFSKFLVFDTQNANYMNNILHLSPGSYYFTVVASNEKNQPATQVRISANSFENFDINVLSNKPQTFSNAFEIIGEGENAGLTFEIVSPEFHLTQFYIIIYESDSRFVNMPEITSFTLSTGNAPAKPNTTLTIYGEYFGNTAANNQIKYVYKNGQTTNTLIVPVQPDQFQVQVRTLAPDLYTLTVPVPDFGFITTTVAFYVEIYNGEKITPQKVQFQYSNS